MGFTVVFMLSLCFHDLSSLELVIFWHGKAGYKLDQLIPALLSRHKGIKLTRLIFQCVCVCGEWGGGGNSLSCTSFQ